MGYTLPEKWREACEEVTNKDNERIRRCVLRPSRLKPGKTRELTQAEWQYCNWLNLRLEFFPENIHAEIFGWNRMPA